MTTHGQLLVSVKSDFALWCKSMSLVNTCWGCEYAGPNLFLACKLVKHTEMVSWWKNHPAQTAQTEMETALLPVASMNDETLYKRKSGIVEKSGFQSWKVKEKSQKTDFSWLSFLQRMRCKLIDILQTLVVKIICIIAWRGPHSTVRNIVIVVNLHLPFFPGIFSWGVFGTSFLKQEFLLFTM